MLVDLGFDGKLYFVTANTALCDLSLDPGGCRSGRLRSSKAAAGSSSLRR